MATIEIDDAAREMLQRIQDITSMDESALLKAIIHNELIAWERARNVAKRQKRPAGGAQKHPQRGRRATLGNSPMPS